MAYAIEVEIDRNYAAFKDILATLPAEVHGQYALLHDQKLDGLYLTAGDADRAGYARYQELPYSIQLVSDEPIDLGFFSYALSPGQTQ
jgi:hypothetical protein